MLELNLEKVIKVGCIKSVLTDCLNKKLFGEMLTLVEAISPNQESSRATKSLVSQAFTRITGRIDSELNNLPDIKSVNK